MKRLEFWPDYGGVLLHADGKSVPLDTLGFRTELVSRAQAWVSRYEDSKVDPPAWDEVWVREGRALFKELGEALAPSGVELEDWEGLWGSADREVPGSK